MTKIEIKPLLDAGVHFGHLTRKWNPNMAPYIFMEKNGIHIINLYKTASKMEECAQGFNAREDKSYCHQDLVLIVQNMSEH